MQLCLKYSTCYILSDFRSKSKQCRSVIPSNITQTRTVAEWFDVCLSALYSRLQPHDSLSVGRSSTVKMGSCETATGFITPALRLLDFLSETLLWKTQPMSEVSWPKQEEHTVHMRGSAWQSEEGAAVQELPLWSGMFPTPGKNTGGCSITDMHEGTLPSSSHPPPPSSLQGHV